MSSCQKCQKCQKPLLSEGIQGFDASCYPCQGCGKVRPGQEVSKVSKNGNQRGFHGDCVPCKVCGKAIPGVGLMDEYIHWNCGGRQNKSQTEEFLWLNALNFNEV